MATTMTLDESGQPVTRRLCLARNATRDANELLGLTRGVLADGSINQSEAEYLLHWLEERPESLSVWPFNVLFQRLSEALSDNYLDSEEEGELMGLLLDFTGGGTASPDIGHSASRQSTALPLCKPAPRIEFEGSEFVLTGKFVTGTRKECEGEIAARGGIPHKSPRRRTRYLVVGNLGSSDWASSSYGRKIEAAVALRDIHGQIAIISEQHWASFL